MDDLFYREPLERDCIDQVKRLALDVTLYWARIVRRPDTAYDKRRNTNGIRYQNKYRPSLSCGVGHGKKDWPPKYNAAAGDQEQRLQLISHRVVFAPQLARVSATVLIT